jgi:hypothetical protein
MARDETLDRASKAMSVRKAWVIALALALVLGSGLLSWFGPNDGTWRPLSAFSILILGSLGGALLSVAVGSIWWESVTREETKRGLMHAVSQMFTQDPEAVAKYFKDSEILDFVRKNLEARTGDGQLAHAIANDLIGPFVDGEGSRTRIRTAQTYTVGLKYGDGTGDPLWLVKEHLSFEERLPFAIGAGSVLAVFVFKEAALAEWFAKDDCMYRAIAHMPRLVARGSVEGRQAWVRAHLACTIAVGDRQLDLAPRVTVDGAKETEWRVTYALKPKDAEAIEEQRIDAEKRAEGSPNPASLKVDLKSRTTHSLDHREYTAYLAYPTLRPVIDFAIEGPVEQVECAAFYSRAARVPGSLSASDLVVDVEKIAEGCHHANVSLSRDRWVFPMSGASFSWSLNSADCD